MILSTAEMEDMTTAYRLVKECRSGRTEAEILKRKAFNNYVKAHTAYSVLESRITSLEKDNNPYNGLLIAGKALLFGLIDFFGGFKVVMEKHIDRGDIFEILRKLNDVKRYASRIADAMHTIVELTAAAGAEGEG
jgi:hypothetical protein